MERSSTEEIKEKLPIEEVIGQYVKLAKAGKDFKGQCPFHSEKTPSFFVSPDKNVWHCFGCSKGGDLFTFVQEIEGLEFRDALQLLADKAGVELRNRSGGDSSQRKQLLDVLEHAAQFYVTTLEEEKSNSRVWQYLKERGVTRELAKEFRLGLAPNEWSSVVEHLSHENIDPSFIAMSGMSIVKDDRQYDRFRGRLMFPIQDVQGAVIGFTGRILPWIAEAEEQKGRTPGKYINSPATPVYDKSRVIYGIHQARQAIRKSDVVVLVEGQLDVLLAHRIGFRQTVAVSGTAFTEDHAKVLRRYTEKIIMLFDMDAAGEKASRRAFSTAAALGMDVKIGALPTGKDPADLALEDPAALEEVLGDAGDALSFFLDRAIERNDMTSARGKRAAMNDVLPLLASLESAVERSHWAGEVGHRLNVTERAVMQELEQFITSQRSYESSSHEVTTSEKTTKARSRRLMLEEHLCGLVAQYPVLVRHLDNTTIKIFTTRPVRGIMDTAITGEYTSLSALQERLSSEDGVHVAQLAFRVEKRIPDMDAAEREFRFLFGDLHRAHLREALQRLSTDMRSAETSVDPERLAELQLEFTEITQQLTEIE